MIIDIHHPAAYHVNVIDCLGNRIPHIQSWDTDKNEGWAYVYDDNGHIIPDPLDMSKPALCKIICECATVVCTNEDLAIRYGLTYRNI